MMMSRVMSKPAFCICDKGVDQVHSNCTADQHLFFCYIDSTIPLPPKSEISSLWPPSVAVQAGCFLSDLVGNPEDRFSREAAHIVQKILIQSKIEVSALRLQEKNIYYDLWKWNFFLSTVTRNSEIFRFRTVLEIVRPFYFAKNVKKFVPK